MNANMTYRKAMNTLVAGADKETTYQARQVVESAVEALCKTDTDGLSEWITAGDYSEYRSAQDIATEWDELSEQ